MKRDQFQLEASDIITSAKLAYAFYDTELSFAPDKKFALPIVQGEYDQIAKPLTITYMRYLQLLAFRRLLRLLVHTDHTGNGFIRLNEYVLGVLLTNLKAKTTMSVSRSH